METVTFKLQERIIKKIDGIIRPLNFNNRTEFIREAIREKLISIERDLVIHELRKFKGTANVSVSDKRLHKIREEVANKYARKLGVKLD